LSFYLSWVQQISGKAVAAYFKLLLSGLYRRISSTATVKSIYIANRSTATAGLRDAV